MRFADLHLHTNFSDGSFSPEELIKALADTDISCIAVADHDTVMGIRPALEEAKSTGIEVLPAIELTAEYETSEIHILGYLIDCENKDLLATTALLKQNRIERIYKMVEKLKKMGLDLEAEAVFSFTKEGTVGRLHVARAMLGAGFVNSVSEAFEKYIGDKKPGYVLGFKLSPREAIDLIKNAGGIPVLAHPYTVSREDVISQIIECGVMGLEAYYPEHMHGMTDFYLELAKEKNLLVTGGSDFHGASKPLLQLGVFKIPYELVERLKAAKKS